MKTTSSQERTSCSGRCSSDLHAGLGRTRPRRNVPLKESIPGATFRRPGSSGSGQTACALIASAFVFFDDGVDRHVTCGAPRRPSVRSR